MTGSKEDFVITRLKDRITLVIHRDIDSDETVNFIASRLKKYVRTRGSSVAPLKLLIDLRACNDFNTSHALKIARIFVAESDVILKHIEAAAILLTMTNTLSLLRSFFRTIYTPLSCFDIFGDEREAIAFLSGDMSMRSSRVLADGEDAGRVGNSSRTS